MKTKIKEQNGQKTDNHIKASQYLVTKNGDMMISL